MMESVSPNAKMVINEEIKTAGAEPSYRGSALSSRSPRRGERTRRIRRLVQIRNKLADMIPLIEDISCLVEIEARLNELLEKVSSMVPVRGCLRGGGHLQNQKSIHLSKGSVANQSGQQTS